MEWDMPASLEDLPARFRVVPYVGERHPGAVGVYGLEGGANCQQYAYEYLRHYGLDPRPLRSSELFEDIDCSVRVTDPEPLDLLLFNDSDSAWGAHVAVYVGQGRGLHLSAEVGAPAIWSLDEFLERPSYRRLVGLKRVTRTVSDNRVAAWPRRPASTAGGRGTADVVEDDEEGGSPLRALAADARPIVVGVCGCPGAGKTTVAASLADTLGLPRLHRDAIKMGLGVSTAAVTPAGIMHLPESFHTGGGAFSLQAEAILRQVARLLVWNGCSFVVETSVLASELVASVHAADGALLAVEVIAEPAVIEKRLEARVTQGEPTAPHLLAQFQRGQMARPVFTPPREADRRVVVDTSEEGAPVLTLVQEVFRAMVTETDQPVR